MMMQVVHEAGHVGSALVTGGKVERVVLHPLTFSRTDVSPNPHPLLEIWAGPIVGVALPVLVWLVLRKLTPESISKFVRFFAGFCCVANGIYIGLAPGGEGMDTQVMLDLGCRRWHLLLFGLPCVLFGLWLWNGTGEVFGIGQPDGRVSAKAMWVSVALLAAIVLVELLLVSTGAYQK